MKFLLFTIVFTVSLLSIEPLEYAAMNELSTPDKTLKEEAFYILKTKCNVCHEKKNKRRIFTPENMNKNSKKIYRQVFKWKRMPKGDEIKLTEEEYTQLRNWIKSINKK